jgi:hypothetical protein
MSEVSTWDPVDDNNTSAPPAGWPEGQAPSSINNCARAMMGALRRFYDSVTSQFAALPTTYLRLTGGTIRDGIDIARFDTTGTYNVTGSWQFISDARAKDADSIQPYHKGLQAVLALQPVSYRYRQDTPFPCEATLYGLIAQDVIPVLPEMVGEADVGGEPRLTLSPTHLVYPLLNAVKELAQENALLEARIATLEDIVHA